MKNLLIALLACVAGTSCLASSGVTARDQVLEPATFAAWSRTVGDVEWGVRRNVEAGAVSLEFDASELLASMDAITEGGTRSDLMAVDLGQLEILARAGIAYEVTQGTVSAALGESWTVRADEFFGGLQDLLERFAQLDAALSRDRLTPISPFAPTTPSQRVALVN